MFNRRNNFDLIIGRVAVVYFAVAFALLLGVATFAGVVSILRHVGLSPI